MSRYDEIAGSVQARFDQTSVYAAEAWEITQTQMTLLSNLTPPGYELAGLDVAWADLEVSVDTADPPDRPDTELVIPDFPPDAVLLDVDDIDPIDIPILNVPEPVYRDPDFPDDEMPDIPTDLPPIGTINFPADLDLDIPDPPDLGPDIIVSDPPDTTIPTFDVEAPEMSIETPGNSFVYSETPYTSELLDDAKAWLIAQLGAGGTGLDADVEQAIIDRARARQVLRHGEKYDEAEQYSSGRHHTLPAGALAGKLLNIQAQIGQEEQQLDDDVLIEQARLAQTNTHFVVEKSLAYESMAINHFNTVAQRAFEVARAVQMATMEVFNAQVTLYNAELEGYKIKASVYEIRVRASTLVLEQYKVLLEGKKLQGEMKQLLLSQYNLQLEGVKTLVSLYAAEMNAANIKAQVNATIIEAHRTRISAYNAIIDGITAKYNAYQAQLAGEQTKADIYKAKIAAYSTHVDAIAKGAQVNIEQVKAQLGVNQLLMSEYIAKLDGVKAKISASSAEVQAILGAYTAEVGGYGEEVKALSIAANAEIEAYKAKSVHETNIVNMGIKRAEIAMDHSTKVYGMLIEQYKSGADIAAQISASALSAVSASASYGYDEGVSANYSYDQTKSVPSFQYITML